MKILFAPAHYMLDGVAGGSEFSWAYNIVRSLATYPDVELIAITGPVKAPAPFPPNVRIITVDASSHLHLTWAYRLLFVFKTFAAARRVLKHEQVDVIHHILPFGFNATFNLLPLLGATGRTPFVIGPLQAPHTYESDEEFIYSQGQFAKYAGLADMVQDRVGSLVARCARRVLASLSQATLRRSTALIAVNDETQRLYMSAVPGIRPQVITPGVHVDAFQQGSGGRSSGLDIITVGWLIKRKGVDVLIRAMVEMKKTFPSVRLRIVGDGPQREHLERLAQDLEVQDVVTFQGFVPHGQIAALYHTADVFVSMSYSESFGQTLVEAMAAGLCVISADNTGARGIIADGRTGFLVPPGDVAALVRVLRHVFDNPAVRESIGTSAQREARERFDWPSIAATYLALYESLT